MATKYTDLKMPKIRPTERYPLLAMIAAVLIPLVRLLFGLKVVGAEKLPKTGPYILVANHVTNLDALAVAYLIYVKLGRAPHFLAKEGLFRTPVVGAVLTAAGQIPVYRSGKRNDAQMAAAHAYLKAGHTIAIFPEGTLTRDPELWPMRGKTGAVRLALDTGVPVYPVGQWGSEKVLNQYGSKFRPGFWKKVSILIGDEIDLHSYRKKQLSPTELHSATNTVMKEITKLVEVLRGEQAPDEIWDPVTAGQKVTGNFKKSKKA
ncbi:MAG: hypothetical protein RIR16_389 [Actinomycetota bacterium]|jgi:1-acyl-sn-glycerol-3-phosphate acyltransferase